MLTKRSTVLTKRFTVNNDFFSCTPVRQYLYLAMLLGSLVGLSACSDSTETTETAGEPLSETERLVQEGRRQSRSCVGCHGPEGISRVSSYPSLAGRSQEYLAEQLEAFRSGERENPMMTSIARNLSDEAILALSHYYASLPGQEAQ